MSEPYTDAELATAAQAFDDWLVACGFTASLAQAARPYGAATTVLDAVLPGHDARVRADERARASLYRLRIAALEDLLACYRTGKRPSEALHRRLESTRAAIEGLR